DPLPRLDVQDGADGLLDRVPGARLSRYPARVRHRRGARTGRHGRLFPVLPVDAVVHDARQNQARPGAAHMTAIRTFLAALLLMLLPFGGVWAAAGGKSCGEIECDPLDIDLSD